MRRVIIFGNSASGKSTHARRLCENAALAHLDLDLLAWTAQMPPTRRPVDDSLVDIFNFLDMQKSWVIEGCYADLLEPLLPHCSEIIFLNLPVSACLANARNRPWEAHKYASKAAQDGNLNMLLAWIAQYEEREDEFSAAAHMALYESFKGSRTMHTENVVGANV